MKKTTTSAVVTTAFIVSTLLAPFATFAQTQKNRPPVITGVSSPTVVNVDQTATWKVNAYDPEQGNLSYSVDWGDAADNLARKSAAAVTNFVQTASFEHSYATAGNYNVKFSVKDDAGKTTSSSITVRVKDAASNPITLSNLIATSSKPTTAVITWNSNIKGSSVLWFGKTSPIDTSKRPSVSQSNQTTKHKIELNRLTPDTTYYLIVKSATKVRGNNVSATSTEISFKTPPLPTHSLAPVIKSVNGPETLVVDDQGTWTITASDPRNQALTYSVTWGDEGQQNLLMRMFGTRQPVFTQTSTFDHTYAASGTYAIVFNVKDESGLTTQSTTTVQVSDATSTPDTGAPVISSVVAGSIQTGQAALSWNTDELADSKVWVGTTTNPDTSVAPTLSNSTLSMSHSLTVGGLVPNTTYYAVVGSSDNSGNAATSSPISFTTLPVATTTAPVVSSIFAEVAGTSIVVHWSTDVAADSAIYYSTANPVVIGATSTISDTDANLVTTHSLTASGLSTSTPYYFLIRSNNSAGTTTSSQFSLTTLGM